MDMYIIKINLKGTTSKRKKKLSALLFGSMFVGLYCRNILDIYEFQSMYQVNFVLNDSLKLI